MARAAKIHKVVSVLDETTGVCQACGTVRIYKRGDRGTWACRDGHRDTILRSRYGISLAEYNALLAYQGGGCAICKRTPEAEGQDLVVDHDHSCCPTDRTCGLCIRGLLCRKCNWGLGLFTDDSHAMTRAIRYLARKTL